MSHVTGRHMPASWLSAYLDGELEEKKVDKVRQHLEDCGECRDRLAGMGSVVASLRGLEHVAPAPALNQWVARRVALEGDQESLMAKVEDRLEIFTRQSTSLFYFSVVIALAAILWLFAWGLERQQNARLEVIFRDLPQLRTGEVMREEKVVLAGRDLSWTGRQWIEAGLTEKGAANIFWGSREADELVAANIELSDLYELAQPVMVIVDGRAVRLRHPPPEE